MQSAGGAVAWQIDTRKVPLLNQLIVNWVLTMLSYPLLIVLVMLAVKNDEKKKPADDANASDLPSSTLPVITEDYTKLDKIST